jgi:hypothetical protein
VVLAGAHISPRSPLDLPLDLPAISSPSPLDLPSISQLHRLETINCDGCVGLKGLPKFLAQLAPLRNLRLLNCTKITDEDCSILPDSVTVHRAKVATRERRNSLTLVDDLGL